jgi:hypothetical protein
MWYFSTNWRTLSFTWINFDGVVYYGYVMSTNHKQHFEIFPAYLFVQYFHKLFIICRSNTFPVIKQLAVWYRLIGVSEKPLQLHSFTSHKAAGLFVQSLASKYRYWHIFTFSVRDQVSHLYSTMDNIALRAATRQNKDVHFLHYH